MLSAIEARQLKPQLIGFLQKTAEYADEGISNTNKMRAKCDIWTGPTGLDDKDYETIADVLIGRAQLDAAVAQAVRSMAAVYERWQILLILGPKFLASYNFYLGNGGFIWPWQS